MNFSPQSRSGGNVFGELVNTVNVCLVKSVAPPARDTGGPRLVETKGGNGFRLAEAAGVGGSLGQITACLTSVVGKFRPMV